MRDKCLRKIHNEYNYTQVLTLDFYLFYFFYGAISFYLFIYLCYFLFLVFLSFFFFMSVVFERKHRVFFIYSSNLPQD